MATTAAIAGSVAALSIFAGGYLGGVVGDAYNTKVDSAVANAPITPLLNH